MHSSGLFRIDSNNIFVVIVLSFLIRPNMLSNNIKNDCVFYFLNSNTHNVFNCRVFQQVGLFDQVYCLE